MNMPQKNRALSTSELPDIIKDDEESCRTFYEAVKELTNSHKEIAERLDAQGLQQSFDGNQAASHLLALWSAKHWRDAARDSIEIAKALLRAEYDQKHDELHDAYKRAVEHRQIIPKIEEGAV